MKPERLAALLFGVVFIVPGLVLIPPSNIFVAHASGAEIFAGVNARLRTFAEERGFRITLMRPVADRHARPIFEVLRFRKIGD